MGFRGKKRDKPTDMEKLLGGTGDAARVRRIAKVEQVSCDNCGLHLADADKPGETTFVKKKGENSTTRAQKIRIKGVLSDRLGFVPFLRFL